MKIQLSDLRRAADALFDHLERTSRTEIDVTEDFYWSIDWNEVTKIASGRRPPSAYALSERRSRCLLPGARATTPES